ncbi:transglycosylase family protein [Actinacidiphila alni]|uniref:transglycosylase family protein n=1 Tax=Actinacidiphila alni TaxID=380248 RepID=UPI0034517F47
MLTSGNGRHRRPRQAPAAVVTVAATGAGIALPLLGAGAAHAADAGTWDKVAICETGGSWSANPGNGFYGGLAITQDTWNEFGGQSYAPRPDLASRTEQIAVAEKMLAELGPNAWPGCEDGTGLLDAVTQPVTGAGKATPAPTTPAPTTSPTASPTTSGDDQGSDDDGTGSDGSSGGSNTDPSLPTILPTLPATPGTPTTPVTPTGPVGDTPTTPATPGTTVPGTPGTPDGTTPPSTGRHAKPYVPTDDELAAVDQASRTELTAVTDAASDDGKTDGKTDGASGTKDAGKDKDKGDDSGHKADGGHEYTVGFGDSLSGIAADHHVQGGWSGLYDANRQLIGDDPNLIKPGQILTLDLG